MVCRQCGAARSAGESLGLPDSVLGDMTAALQLSFIAGTLVFAVLAISDRYSPRLTFLACALAGAACNASAWLADGSISLLLSARFAVGFFLAGIYPVGMKIASGLVPARSWQGAGPAGWRARRGHRPAASDPGARPVAAVADSDAERLGDRRARGPPHVLAGARRPVSQSGYKVQPGIAGGSLQVARLPVVLLRLLRPYVGSTPSGPSCRRRLPPMPRARRRPVSISRCCPSPSSPPAPSARLRADTRHYGSGARGSGSRSWRLRGYAVCCRPSC